jgi:hypothetical protein
MNKCFLLSAAAILATTTASPGNTLGGFSFGTSGGAPSCDGFTVYSNGASVWSVTYNNCSGPISYGQGLLGRYPAVAGRSADVSDNILGVAYGIFSEYISFSLPGRLKAGKPWEMWIGLNGTTSFLANSGVLVEPNAQHRPGKSIKAGLKQLLQARPARS